MKNIFLIITFIFLCANLVSAQNPLVKQWDNRFGGNDDDLLTCFQQTFDGGYILGGWSFSGNGGNKTQYLWGGVDYWVVKINSIGNKQWDKDFGGAQWDYLSSLQQTSDGGFILGGYSYSGISGDKTQTNWDTLSASADYWIVKMDSLGNIQWDRDFGGTAEDELRSVHQTQDGGFILGGYSGSGISGDKTQYSQGGLDYWIVKIDSLGNKQWDRDFGGTTDDKLSSIHQTSDGGYILGGYSGSGIGGDKSQGTWGYLDYWIVKTDSLGNKQWDKDFGGINGDVLYSIEQTFDGGFILGGYSNSGVGGDKTQSSWGYSDYWILKIDSLGNKEWDKDFGGTSYEDEFGNVIQTVDKGYLVSGASHSSISGDKSENNLGASQSWIIKTDSTGNKQWDKTIFTNGYELVGHAIQTRDGCYAIANYSNGGIAGYKTNLNWNQTNDYWIVKFCDSTLNQLPVSYFSAAITNICSGNCTGFNNISLYANTQTWVFPGGSPSSSNDPNPQNICYNTAGTFDVTLITYNNYGSDTLTLPGYITVYPEPNVPNIIQSGDTLIAQSGYYSYQWYYFSNTIPSATNYFYIAAQNGDYSVVVTDSNGCDAGRGIVNVITGIKTVANPEESFYVFPNPSGGTFTIQFNSALKNSRITITDVFGEYIFSTLFDDSLPGSRMQIRLDVPDGIYLLKYIDDKKILTSKIIIRN